MAQPYDTPREIERLENRIYREMDRRFAEINERLVELKEQIKALDGKLDAATEKEEGRLYEKHTWGMRQVITLVIAFVMGGGALEVIQAVVQALARGR